MGPCDSRTGPSLLGKGGAGSLQSPTGEAGANNPLAQNQLSFTCAPCRLRWSFPGDTKLVLPEDAQVPRKREVLSEMSHGHTDVGGTAALAPPRAPEAGGSQGAARRPCAGALPCQASGPQCEHHFRRGPFPAGQQLGHR